MQFTADSNILNGLTMETVPAETTTPTIPKVALNSEFVALTDDNTLISFDPSNSTETDSVAVTGVQGALLGIDTRPADGLIYGITTANNIYTIDADSGAATYISTLDTPFEGGTISGFDFNPVADRLRLVGDNDQNFRINVDTGEVTVDGTLAFADGDTNQGVNPNVTAAAYTNSFDGTDSTELYNIDTLLNDLVLQNPPNDGTLVTVGDLGIDFGTLGGFDILSSPDGDNAAFAVSDSTLYTIDIDTGMAFSVGEIGSDNSNLQGLAVVSPDSDRDSKPTIPEVALDSKFVALTDDNTLISFDPSKPTETDSVAVTGVDGVLLGIDTRPADGLIYGITTANNIYTIDADSGAATYISTLDTPFEGGTISGFDFNPVADRLRLVGDNDQNFRINVDTGEVTVDGTLAFADGDTNQGVNPNVTAAAYTNSFDGTDSTELYNIDTLLNDLVLQNPPNDGTLVTVGDLGIDFGTLGGFDILSSPDGDNAAFAVSNSTLYTVDLDTGMAFSMGEIGSDNPNLQGLTIVSDNSDVDTEFSLPLEEAQSVPKVPDTEAEGSFDAVLSGNTLTVSGEFSDLTSPLFFVGGEDGAGNPESPIHIHVGETGETGPILRNLDVVDNGDNSGSFSGSFELSAEDAALIEADRAYINLHTEENNDGELRGQVEIDDNAVNSGLLLDLTDINDSTVNFTVDRNAGFENTVGFYEVDSQGNITDSVSGNTINVGDEGYTAAAIANRSDISLTGANQTSTEFTAELAGGSIYAPFLVVDGTIEQLEDGNSSNDPVVYFPFLGANSDNTEHIRNLGDNILGFEDLSNGGDFNYSDLVVEFDFA